jgi:hypothetical protein
MFDFNVPAVGNPADALEIQANFAALATTNFTEDAAYPLNPRDGMQRVYKQSSTVWLWQIYKDSSWVTIKDIFSTSGTLQRDELTITTPAAVWTFTHGFGVHPLVQVQNSSGYLLSPASIQHTSVNQVVVTHGSPQTGKIVVIG